LKDVTLVDRDAIKFLIDCKAGGIKLENCPPYIREWIERESGRPRRKDK
jgi:predicted metal-binding protein